MLEIYKPDNLEELALLTSSALDVAIFALSTGNSDVCLDTLRSLHEMTLRVSGLNKDSKIKISQRPC